MQVRWHSPQMQVSQLPNPYSDNSRQMHGKITPKESELTGSIKHIAHFRYLRTATLNSIPVRKEKDLHPRVRTCKRFFPEQRKVEFKSVYKREPKANDHLCVWLLELKLLIISNIFMSCYVQQLTTRSGVLLGNLAVHQLVTKFLAFVKAECLLLCSQQQATCAYPEPDESSPRPRIPPQ